ncbi:BMC domain-containing protein [Geosporobacter ferrireducens]|uniref:Propanediol utilization protein n=2 Tax=Geosporobacter ferrireducens TaxID=1424294 RepID=A0A1D8GP96_9FIRM|nr:BMC domain-containing protein [Geosporobacter ferrireducens]AOT72722.1 propanediol utilization protein [Geosporobacter ferrireducens]MTI55132.1 BMC domain-containing protein [Geosporobacter ferrireducens]
MKKSLGLVEYKSIAKGIEATDKMLKAANVELILSTPLCPGKYISLIRGDVGAVKTAVKIGRDTGGIFTVEDFIIPNVHPQVFPALTATADVKKITSLGVVETISAVASVMAGDIAVKAANIELMEIRLARGLGGKGFVVITGEISSVKSAVQACENHLKETGQIVSATVIAAPHKELIPKLL